MQKFELCAKSNIFVIPAKKPRLNMLMKLMPGVVLWLINFPESFFCLRLQDV
jgi:hypothetical protein